MKITIKLGLKLLFFAPVLNHHSLLSTDDIELNIAKIEINTEHENSLLQGKIFKKQEIHEEMDRINEITEMGGNIKPPRLVIIHKTVFL